MVTEQQKLKLAQRLFRAKESRRRALANLPFHEKISILVRLQHIADEVRSATGRPRQRAWAIAVRPTKERV